MKENNDIDVVNNDNQEVKDEEKQLAEGYTINKLAKERQENAGREKEKIDNEDWIKTEEGLDSYKDSFKVERRKEVNGVKLSSLDALDRSDVNFETKVKDNNDGFDLYNEHLNDEYKKKDDNNIINEEDDEGQDFVDDEIIEKELEDEPLPDAPLVVDRKVGEAIEKARKDARDKVTREHAAAKKEYDKAIDLRTQIVSLSETIASQQGKIIELEEILKDSSYSNSMKNGIKDSIESLREMIKVEMESRSKISNEAEAEALKTINAYEKADKNLEQTIADAEKAAEEKVRAQEKARQDEERYVESEKKKYKDYRKKRNEIKWSKQYNTEYSTVKKQNFNEELELAVQDADAAPKEDIYRLNILTKRNGDFIQLKSFSELELLNVDQVFDRTFRSVNNFYDNYYIKSVDDIGTNFLENLFVLDKIGNEKNAEIEIVKKPLVDYVSEIMALQQIDPKEVDLETFNRYAKAIVFQFMQDNRREVVFQPHVYDKNGNYVRADEGDEGYSFKLNDMSGLIKDPKRIKELNGEPYQRIGFNKMTKDDLDNRDYEQEAVNINEVDEEDALNYEGKGNVTFLKNMLAGDAKSLEEDPDFKAEGIEKTLSGQKKAQEEENINNEEEINANNDQFTEIDLGEDEYELDYLVNKENIINIEDKSELGEDSFSIAPKIEDERGKIKSPEEIEAEKAAELNRVKELQEKIVKKAKDRMKLDDVSIRYGAEKYLGEHSGLDGWDIHEMYKPQSFLLGASDNFPSFTDEISDITIAANVNDAVFISEKEHELKYIPNAVNADRYMITEPEIKLKMAMDRAKFEELYTAIYDVEAANATATAKKKLNDFEKTLDKNDPDYAAKVSEFKKKNDFSRQPNMRVLDIISNHKDLFDSPYFESVYEKFSPEFQMIEAAMLNFPGNAFYAGKDDSDNPIYKPDNKRYEKMLERVPFLDVVEDNQNFLINHVIPYEKAKRKGTITREQISDFEKAYKEHIDNQNKYFKKLGKIKADDPDVSQLRVFYKDFNQKYTKNWMGPRLAETAMKTSEQKLSIMDRGWPLEDCAFITQLIKVESDLQSALSNNKYSEEKKKEAREVLKELAPTMKVLKNSYVVNPEMRDDILERLENPINRFIKWDYTNPRKTVPTDVYVGHPITDLYKEALVRKVYASEMGKGSLRIIEEKKGVMDTAHAGKDNILIETIKLPTAISDELLIDNVNSMVDDLHSVELIRRGSGEFKEMKIELESLQNYAGNLFKERIDLLGDIQKRYLESLVEFKNRAIAAQSKVQKYLEHKEVDFNESRTRRDSRGKQGTEQSRIKMAINNYDKLSFIIDKIQEYEDSLNPVKQFEKNELPEIVEKTKNKLKDKIDAEEAKIKNKEKPQSKNEFVLSVCRIAMSYMIRNNHNRFVLNGSETPEHFRKRMEEIQNKDYSVNELNAMSKNDKVLKNIITKYGKKYDDNDIEDVSKEQVFTECYGAIVGAAEAYKADSKKEKSNYFKDKLISTQNKDARKLREQQKEKLRKK